MEKGERQTGNPAQVAGSHEPQRVSRPAPGKVTRTSRIEPSRGPAVQRKAAAPVQAAPQSRSLSAHTSDAWMDAAHRGVTALSDTSPDPVQARGDMDAQDPAAVHRAAAAGVSGSGGAMPHLDRIQESFGGAHDVSQVRAHVGGEATAASRQMGAQAYATGNHVAFAGQPDLHTAAHEAAHVVQQRRGVQLAGGVGAAGDAYERHADAVADRVVQGKSATDLLDTMAGSSRTGGPGSGGAATGAGIQMLEDPGATSTQGGAGAGATSTTPTPGSATVIGTAADTEYAFDNSFTPALVAALQNNPNLSLDEVLATMPATSLGAPATDNDGGLHHPTIVQYGQNDENANVCRDNEKVAVLIANQNYVNISPLSTPIAEANAMSGELVARGYDSNVHNDKSSRDMSTLWNGMVASANEGDDLVAFYGGHGAPEGLCGINDDIPPNPTDLFTNGEVAGVVSAATSKGAHIRFVMDSCHSGEAAEAVREERENELAENADSLGDHLRVAALGGLRTAKKSLVDHCRERERVLQTLDDAIAEHDAKEPDPSAAAEHAAWAAISTGLQGVRSLVQSAYDAKADAMWTAMSAMLLIVKAAVGHPEAPPAIADYRTLGAQVNYLDDIWNTCAQPMERELAGGSDQ
jgi:hypothetical protein